MLPLLLLVRPMRSRAAKLYQKQLRNILMCRKSQCGWHEAKSGQLQLYSLLQSWGRGRAGKHNAEGCLQYW